MKKETLFQILSASLDGIRLAGFKNSGRIQNRIFNIIRREVRKGLNKKVK